jgi:transglutaminase-like putative cysteine protease
MMMEPYLQPSEMIDWENTAIIKLAKTLALNQQGPIAIARSCFEWVRDEIRHSYDYQMNPVTCRASDVLWY